MAQSDQLRDFKRSQFESTRALFPGEITLAGTVYQGAVRLGNVTVVIPEIGRVVKYGGTFWIDRQDLPAEPKPDTVITHQGVDYLVQLIGNRNAEDPAWRLICTQRFG